MPENSPQELKALYASEADTWRVLGQGMYHLFACEVTRWERLNRALPCPLENPFHARLKGLAEVRAECAREEANAISERQNSTPDAAGESQPERVAVP